MRFAVYNAATGIIQRVMTCDWEDIVIQLSTGLDAIEMEEGDDSTHFVVESVATPLPAKPGEHFTFDWATRSWVDQRTLQELKDAQWAVIKDARAAAEFGGFTWDGSTFDSDAMSQSRIQGALQLASMSPNFSIEWTLKDNSARVLSAADLQHVGEALGLHVATQHAAARIHRADIEAATTAAQILSITW